MAQALQLSSLFKDFSLHILKLNRDADQEVDVLNGWFWMVRRSAIDTVGLLDEEHFMYGEDIDWCHRFRRAGWRVLYYPKAAAIHYCGGSSSRAPSRYYVEMQRANLQYWRRYHNPLSVGAYLLIVFLHQLLRLAGYSAMYVVKPAARTGASAKLQRSSACLRWLFGLYRDYHTV